MSFSEKVGLFYVGFLCFWLVSWCVNIYKFSQLDFQSTYKAEVIRAISIPVAPLSLVSAWVDIGEENEN